MDGKQPFRGEYGEFSKNSSVSAHDLSPLLLTFWT
jgi:hypothetical protein